MWNFTLISFDNFVSFQIPATNSSIALMDEWFAAACFAFTQTETQICLDSQEEYVWIGLNRSVCNVQGQHNYADRHKFIIDNTLHYTQTCIQV